MDASNAGAGKRLQHRGGPGVDGAGTKLRCEAENGRGDDRLPARVDTAVNYRARGNGPKVSVAWQGARCASGWMGRSIPDYHTERIRLGHFAEQTQQRNWHEQISDRTRPALSPVTAARWRPRSAAISIKHAFSTAPQSRRNTVSRTLAMRGPASRKTTEFSLP